MNWGAQRGPPGPSERTGQSDDAMLHGMPGIPCVPIGSEFQHAGGIFVRTGELSVHWGMQAGRQNPPKLPENAR